MSEAKKVALVTGANKGIGLETARQLGDLGYKVYLGCRDAARGMAAVQALQDEGHDAHLLVLDIERPESIAAGAEELASKEAHLDALVNNAAIQIDAEDFTGTNASTVSPDTLRRTFDINFFGLIDLTQRLLPLLRKSEAGRIVNLSSILGSLKLHSDPKSPIYSSKPVAYNVSKTAVNGYTVHLAWELRDTPIKVNAAHPGWVKTEMGGPNAPMDLVTGAKTSVQLATLPADGPTGAYLHLGETLPW